ncbi:MAG TPA: fumarylacetoacetate hydrolase family protein [Ilumatobacter sp.]|nr:fumarylacetoacetate hydrolase family protein [Ilumatobacter sp.]
MSSPPAELAARLAEAERTGTPIAPFVEIPAGDLDAAYAVQQASVTRWLAGGRRIVGRKIGLTSPKVQAQLGVDQPDFGVLFDDMQYASGVMVPTGRVLQPRVEAEVAFQLVADLTDGDSIDAGAVRAAVGSIAASIEIVGSRIADWRITITDTIADNASSGAFVLGDTAILGDLDLANVTMEMTRSANGRTDLVSTGSGRDCLGSPLISATWLARHVARLGTPLRAGDIVLTGALGPMVAVQPGDRFAATIAGVGSVEVAFT